MSTTKSRKLLIGVSVLIVLLLAGGAYWYFKPAPKKIPVNQQMVVAGVGLHLAWIQPMHKFVIDRIYPNSPAEKMGLTPGLVLNKVDGKFVETNNLWQLSDILRGPVGTKVKVELIDISNGLNNGVTNEVEVVREQFINHSKRDGNQPPPPADQ